MVYGALFPMPEILIELRMKRTVKFLCFFVMLFCFASMDAKKRVKQTVIPQLENYSSVKLDEFHLHGGNLLTLQNKQKKKSLFLGGIGVPW